MLDGWVVRPAVGAAARRTAAGGCGCALICAAVLCFGLGSGCPSAPDPPASGLTDSERTALAVVRDSLTAYGAAVLTAQYPADARADAGTTTTGFGFGTCPVVGGHHPGGSAEFLNLSIDYGQDCAPFGDAFTASGSAQGTFARGARGIQLSLQGDHGEGMDFGGLLVAGDEAWTYALTPVGADLSGTMKVNWTRGDAYSELVGTAVASFDRTAGLTGTSSFAASINLAGPPPRTALADYRVVAGDLVVTYPGNQQLMPASGKLAIRNDIGAIGGAVRDMTVIFDSQSPATGTVQVQFEDGASESVTLTDLAIVLPSAQE